MDASEQQLMQQQTNMAELKQLMHSVAMATAPRARALAETAAIALTHLNIAVKNLGHPRKSSSVQREPWL